MATVKPARNDPLPGYLARTMALPWSWGLCDCTTWVADWVRETTGRDPAAALRGRYSTALGCRRVIEAHPGGLAGIAAEGLASIGAAEICPGDAMAGDVAVIIGGAEGQPAEVAAIRGIGGCWLAKIDGGIARHPADAAVRAWRI